MTIDFLPKDNADGYAIQALAGGEASPDQQRRALKCIVEEIAGAYFMTFDPASDRQSAFNEGRRHVGRCIVGLLKLNLGKLQEAEKRKGKKEPDHGRRNRTTR